MPRRIRKVPCVVNLHQDGTYWTAKQSLADIHGLDTALIKAIRRPHGGRLALLIGRNVTNTKTQAAQILAREP